MLNFPEALGWLSSPPLPSPAAVPMLRSELALWCCELVLAVVPMSVVKYYLGVSLGVFLDERHMEIGRPCAFKESRLPASSNHWKA